jgi:hypothetical protein
MRLRALLGATGVMVAVAASATSGFAQEAALQHPADIRVGSCASLGEVVVPLAPLVVPVGDPQGQAGAPTVAQSVTEVPVLLMDLLAASNAVVVQASPEQLDTPIACAEIGGTLSDDGSLAVGLQAMNGARISGVASFASTRADDGTLVTLQLVDERSGRERGDDVAAGADAGDGATAGDGANAADGVGNVTVGPASDRAPGEDGVVDSPGRDSDGGRGADGESGHNGGGNDRRGQDTGSREGVARAGEDGTTSR